MSLCKEEVFQKTFQNLEGNVQRFILSKGVSLSNTADYTQEVFVKLWQNCAKVNVDKALAFLFTVAQNLIIDEYRKSKTQLKIKSEFKQNTFVEDGQFKLETSEFKLKLESAIDGMTQASKEVFLMNRFNDMTYRQIAEHLGISVKAVEKRMHKALLHLSSLNILKRK